MDLRNFVPKTNPAGGCSPARRSLGKCFSVRKLFADAEFFDYCTVTLDILLLKIVEEVTSVTYHLEHAATAVEVLVVSLEVLGKSCDSVSKNSDLNLRRTGVSLMYCVLSNNVLLFVLEHRFFTFL